MIANFRNAPHVGAALGLMLLACALLCRPAWSVGSILTQDELGRLLKVVDKSGSRTAIPPSVASVLQLQPGQYTPDIKEIAFLDSEGNRHGFAPLSDSSGYFMVYSGASLGQIVYLVDSNMRLVKAARSLVLNGPLIALAPTEAQRELDEEFGRWSKVLSPNGPSARSPFKKPGTAPPGGPEPAAPYPFKKPDQKSP
jgi:hypothetical protein